MRRRGCRRRIRNFEAKRRQKEMEGMERKKTEVRHEKAVE
jgi:hypothetical protein